MKIVFFTNTYKPMINGIVSALALFRKGLMARGHEVYIFAPAQRNWKDEEENIFRFPAVNLSPKIYYPVALPCYPGLTKLLRRIKPDIIHCHHPAVLGVTGLRQAKKHKIPAAFTFHTQYEQYAHYFPFPEPLVRWAIRRQVRNFVNRVDLLITPAESVAELIHGYGLTNEIKILPNPVDLYPYQNQVGIDIRERYSLGNSRLLLSVGRLSHEKNLELMLKSFALIPQENVKLMLVGTGPAEEALQKYAVDLGLSNKVIFTGCVEQEVLLAIYQTADLFLMTSTSETFGLVLIEAMAAGLPVVAVEAKGSKDNVTTGSNGVLTPEDPVRFAAAAQDLVADDFRRKTMSQAALETAVRYSMEHLSGRLIELYGESIEQYEARRRKE